MRATSFANDVARRFGGRAGYFLKRDAKLCRKRTPNIKGDPTGCEARRKEVGILWGGTQKWAQPEERDSAETHSQGEAHFWVVGVTGLEPATSSSRTTRASQLRYTPWSQEWDSNPRPTRYECVALPTELSWQARR